MRVTAFLLAIPACAAAASAQSYSIPWYTIDGGGGTSSGGGYTLTGTIGQADAGGPMTGGNFALVGGFWGASGPGCRADLTGDGELNTNDFFAFLAAYQAQDPAADFAPGGGINTNDFFAFLAAYQAGC